MKDQNNNKKTRKYEGKDKEQRRRWWKGDEDKGEWRGMGKEKEEVGCEDDD